jgi:peptide/nickel transport system substrate-binding protein
LVTAYGSIGEAYRSDRFTGFVAQPDPGGVLLFQYGHMNYLNLKPVTAANTASGGIGGAGGSDDGSSTGQMVAIVLVVVVLLVLAVLVTVWAMRRRAGADARE